MKKIILFILLIVIVGTVFAKEDLYVIPNESIRFRIIPNSNSSEDIIMKERATAEVIDVINKIEITSISSTRGEILNNINNIETRLDRLFKNNNYDETFNIKYGLNEFPKKKYKGITYEEGVYESLVIEIGEAKGNNYWCVLYPPLCLIDETLEDKEYKSKIIEIVKKIF